MAEADVHTRQLKVINRLGMHARAAARFVAVASGYPCEITVEHGSRRVNGKSIMGLMMLAAGQGSELRVEARGEDATEALDALETLLAERFGEDS